MNSCRNCFWSTAWFFGTPPGVAVAVTFWRSVLETPPRLIDILRSRRSCAEAQSTARGGRQCGRGCSGGNGARRPARAGLVRRGLGLRRTPVGVAELVLAGGGRRRQRRRARRRIAALDGRLAALARTAGGGERHRRMSGLAADVRLGARARRLNGGGRGMPRRRRRRSRLDGAPWRDAIDGRLDALGNGIVVLGSGRRLRVRHP